MRACMGPLLHRDLVVRCCSHGYPHRRDMGGPESLQAEEARAEKGAADAARAEEEARKKALREAVLKAQREKEAQREAAEAAKRRQQDAKRDADRKMAMQVCETVPCARAL